MAYRQYKDSTTLTYDENVKRLRFTASLLLNDVLNEAIHEMTEEFKEALARGDVLHFEASAEELKALLRRAAEKELRPEPKGVARALNGRK